MFKLQNNTTSLQNLLEQVNALPEADGVVELPELTNEGTATDLLFGKELIDSNGQVITGSFSIDAELTTQDDLIAQIQAAVDSLPEAGSGGSSTGGIETVTVSYSSAGLDERILNYIDYDLQYKTLTVGMGPGNPSGSISIVKNSIIAITNGAPVTMMSGNITYLGGGYGTHAYVVTGNATLEWSA